MARDRKGAQLSVELPPELLQRLKAAAAASDRPVVALVRRWIEAGLSGALDAPAAPAGPDVAELAERVGRIEAELAELRRPAPVRPAASPPRVERLGDGLLEIKGSTHPQPVAKPPAPQPPDPPASGITTAELAERTGTNRAAWNNWARDKKPGAVRKMPPEVGSWRLAGKGRGSNGGPERWLWEPAS